jgi:NSS family neurotransmitter:Na+ symporter
MPNTERGQWGSRLGFVMAAAGSAVGLGNIWRFPYLTGTNGGGWFVLIYLACVALVGIPIMTAEIMIGRAAQKQPVVAFQTIQGGRTAWAGVGWLGLAAGFIILSYYVVVAGWAMDYTLKSISNFTGPIREAAELESIAWRASADPAQVRLELVRAEGRRDAQPQIDRIRNTIRPSAWRAYERYAAALVAADALDVPRVERLGQLWAGEGDLAPPEASRQITDADRRHYQRVRETLLEKPGFAQRLRPAEELLPSVEQAEREALRRAGERIAGLSDLEVRSAGEDLKRRTLIRDRVQAAFGAVAGDGWMSLFWTALFVLATVLIVAGGISGGIERACAILMPALFVLLVVLVIYGTFQRGFGAAIDFVFKPDATKLHASSFLAAMGQAFFSLSLGMGAMITYGSYQKSKEALVGQSVTIASLDTAVALLACLMIFPIVFSYGQEPSQGPGLVFQSMPLAFVEIGRGGMLLAVMFFGLLVFAALTSSISLLEVVASYFIDERGWPRGRAAWVLGALAFALSVPSAFAGDAQFAMSGWAASYGIDFFSTMDRLASDWLLPVGGFLIALYAGWVMPARMRKAELEGLSPALLLGWLILVRIVAPALVIVILLQSIGILDADELFHALAG